MIRYLRDVRFHEVDAAGILFFPHFLTYAHEAMEHFFEPLEGGYPSLITLRRIGLPAVHLKSEFVAPVRFGDTLSVETSVLRLGNRSLTFGYRFVRAKDSVLSAEIEHTVVSTDLVALASCPMPTDVRRVAEQHLVAEGSS